MLRSSENLLLTVESFEEKRRWRLHLNQHLHHIKHTHRPRERERQREPQQFRNENYNQTSAMGYLPNKGISAPFRAIAYFRRTYKMRGSSDSNPNHHTTTTTKSDITKDARGGICSQKGGNIHKYNLIGFRLSDAIRLLASSICYTLRCVSRVVAKLFLCLSLCQTIGWWGKLRSK